MRRSYSHTYLNSQISPQVSISIQNVELNGSLVKKFNDPNAAAWDGLSLQAKGLSLNVGKKSEMRWKEGEMSKRTIDPKYNLENPTYLAHSFARTPSGSISDMINRGFSKETLGNLNRKVIVAGKPVCANAMSYDNIQSTPAISGAYRNLHPGHVVPIEKRQKRSSVIGEDLSVSQISTLPGPHKEIFEEIRPVKIRADCRSSINELPGSLKNPEMLQDPPNPQIKFTRNTATTLEKQVQWGPPKEKQGPKQEIIPTSKVPSYSQVGKESNVIPT